MLGAAIYAYACLIGWLDYAIGITSDVLRWSAYIVFLLVTAMLVVQAVRLGFRRVSPYFVAHQLESRFPECKNSLINWLDLHGEELPKAFQRHLSARAAEQFRDNDADGALRQRKQWAWLGAMAPPALGLIVLLAMAPGTFLGSMAQAFAPFWTPDAGPRTQISLLQPSGDAEVDASQALLFAAKIDGRVPGEGRGDSPTLHYRYQPSEDYLMQPLRRHADGTWMGQLAPSQLRTGLLFKISAGDNATPEHRVRVRTAVHVRAFEATYYYRAYRKLPPRRVAFPNADGSTPRLHGMRGTEVELVIRATRPVQAARIELLTNGFKKDLPCRKLADDANAFACKWLLERNAQFRVVFTTTDGEANADRDLYPIDVAEDEAPIVVLTKPAQASIPENGFLPLAGYASDDVGVRSLALQMRVALGPNIQLAPLAYRPEKSFKLEDGTYPDRIDYADVLVLDELKDDSGKSVRLPAGTVLEYWLEAYDSADYPSAAGNLGKSAVYELVVSAAAKDAKSIDAQRNLRDKALEEKKAAAQKQDQDQAQRNAKKGQKGIDPQKDQDIAKKLDQAADQENRGGAKSSTPEAGTKKDGGPSPGDGPQPQQKSPPPSAKEDAGASKDQGKGQSASGESRSDEQKKSKQDSASKGDRKDGSPDAGSTARDGGQKMDQPAGGAKDAGTMGGDAPPAPMPKPAENADGAPQPQAKGSTPPQTGDPMHGSAKGVEQLGPDVAHKEAPGHEPPGAAAKSSMGDHAGDSKQGDPGAGQAREADRPSDQKDTSWGDLAKLAEKLTEKGESADAIAKQVAGIAQQADDARKRDIAATLLTQNGRDPRTGEKVKGANPFGSGGVSSGLGEDVKVLVANRELARRIGQMQLDDWKKQMSPEKLKRAGISEADWQRFVKSRLAHDAQVRQQNAKLLREIGKDLGGSLVRPSGPNAIQSIGNTSDSLDAGNATPPQEFLDAQRRLTMP